MNIITCLLTILGFLAGPWFIPDAYIGKMSDSLLGGLSGLGLGWLLHLATRRLPLSKPIHSFANAFVDLEALTKSGRTILSIEREEDSTFVYFFVSAALGEIEVDHYGFALTAEQHDLLVENYQPNNRVLFDDCTGLALIQAPLTTSEYDTPEA